MHQALESDTTDNIKGPKTEAGYRVIPIPEKVLTEQTHLMEAFKAQKGKPLDYIFTQVLPQNKGKHHTESSLYSYWNNFKRQLDIDMGAEAKRNKIIKSKVSDDLKPYVLRHTYCTDLQKAGVPINVAKYLMGHEDIYVTANIYTHKDDETVKMAANIINGSSKMVSKKANQVLRFALCFQRFTVFYIFTLRLCL